MSNEIAIYALKDMQIMAEAVARSGLFGMKSADQALALMLVAQSENQHPATITQDYDIIQGKACRKTHSVMARFQQMGGKVEWHALTDVIADATFSHPAGGSLRIEWTFEQAKKANLTGKDNWKNYPRAMLRARVIAEGVRAVYPAAIGGMMIAEEASDAPIYSMADAGAIESAATVIKKLELPECTTEKFNEMCADVVDSDGVITRMGWKSLVTSGTKEVAHLLAMLQTKYTFSDEQIKTVKSWEPANENA